MTPENLQCSQNVAQCRAHTALCTRWKLWTGHVCATERREKQRHVGERGKLLVLKTAAINGREIKGWEMQWLLSAMRLYRVGTTVLVSLSQALRLPSWWNLGVGSALRSCLVQLCPVLSSRSVSPVFWGTTASAEWYENKSVQAGDRWEENCKTYQSYGEGATRQKGVKRFFCHQKNVHVWSLHSRSYAGSSSQCCLGACVDVL